MLHCQLLQTDEIQAVIGDASRNGAGGTQYCGIWSLTSRYRVFNAFGNSYAGLIPGELRGKAPTLELVDDACCALWRAADDHYPVEARAEYRLVAPNAIDHTLTFVDRADVRQPGCDFREVSWCNYMNCPKDVRIHFLSQGEWYRHLSPAHGVQSHIAPAYLPDDQLEVWPTGVSSPPGGRPFHWDRIARRFDAPFYYGRLGAMVLILVFDSPRWLRFFCSPSGGGASLIAGQHCPAWDFQWVIPRSAYEVGRSYTLRMRLLYQPYISDELILEQVRAAQRSVGFETP